MAGAHTAPRPPRSGNPDRAPAGHRAPEGHRAARPRRGRIRGAAFATAALATVAALTIALSDGSSSPRQQSGLVPAALPSVTTTTAAPAPTSAGPAPHPPTAAAVKKANVRPRAAVTTAAPRAAPAAATVQAAGNLFAGAKLYADPTLPVAANALALRATRPADAAELSKIANTPQADWVGGWVPTSAIQAYMAAKVATIRASGALPLFVAYDIPNRDCGGGYSAGGESGVDAYGDWVRGFAAGLGHGPAAVVLEPDALAQITCLPAAQQGQRYAMLRNAVQVIGATGAGVYLDAGSPGWIPAGEMANRLKQAGVGSARGFSVDVSNFQTTPVSLAYGDAVVAALGGSGHFVVDTSRNGLGPAPDNQWCNPAGRALGHPPTAATGDPRADALLWVKRPGESDGTCNGGPAAGQWWTDYAVGLASRAAA